VSASGVKRTCDLRYADGKADRLPALASNWWRASTVIATFGDVTSHDNETRVRLSTRWHCTNSREAC
jgi:hypothetical protein